MIPYGICLSLTSLSMIIFRSIHIAVDGIISSFLWLSSILLDGGAWWATVHGVVKSWTQLSNFPFTFHFHALEKEMATHSSILAWRIPGTGEPGGLQPMGSHRVGHDWCDLAAAVFYCVYVPYLLYPFICQWIFRFFRILAIVNSAAMNIGVHVSF